MSQPTSRRSPKGGGGGFTLIEMLVVIVILGMLMSLAVVGVTSALRTARANKTEAMIGNLTGACESYRTIWGDYPPSTLAEFRVPMPNDTNNGIESMTACLASKRKGEPKLNLPDDQLMNADADYASGNITGWYFGDTALREVSDGFGFALVYLHWKDYEKPSPNTRRIKPDAAGTELSFEPARSEHTRTHLRPMKFQLFSIGPDGKPGTADDVQAR